MQADAFRIQEIILSVLSRPGDPTVGQLIRTVRDQLGRRDESIIRLVYWRMINEGKVRVDAGGHPRPAMTAAR